MELHICTEWTLQDDTSSCDHFNNILFLNWHTVHDLCCVKKPPVWSVLTGPKLHIFLCKFLSNSIDTLYNVEPQSLVSKKACAIKLAKITKLWQSKPHLFNLPNCSLIHVVQGKFLLSNLTFLLRFRFSVFLFSLINCKHYLA